MGNPFKKLKSFTVYIMMKVNSYYLLLKIRFLTSKTQNRSLALLSLWRSHHFGARSR